MKQNKYDDPNFFAAYSAMPRSVEGLVKAGEWETFRSMLPDLTGKRVLDLGCGFGWHCRYARELGARAVVGVDISENMLSRAHELTNDPAIEYRLGAVEDVDVVDGEFDVVISSLALHYVADIGIVFETVSRGLRPGGAFVFSVEHPIFTSRAEQDWWRGDDGRLLHWPVDGYQDEGMRRTNWLAVDVVKYHRTLSTYVNSLVQSGFRILEAREPGPSEEMVRANPDMADEARRPMFLLMSAVRAT